MKLRNEQIDTFEGELTLRFVDRIAEHLREHYASSVQNIDPKVLRARVAHGLDTARSFDLCTDRATAKFVVLMIIVSPRFHRTPAFSRILRDKQIPPQEKINAIIERATEEDWEAARETGGEQAWPADLRSS